MITLLTSKTLQMIDIVSSSHDHFKSRNNFGTSSTVPGATKQSVKLKFLRNLRLFQYKKKHFTWDNPFCRASSFLWCKELNRLLPAYNRSSRTSSSPHAKVDLKLLTNICPECVFHSQHKPDCFDLEYLDPSRAPFL